MDDAIELTGEEKGREISDLGVWEKEDKKQGKMQQVKTFESVIFVAQILIISYGSNMWQKNIKQKTIGEVAG